MPSIQLVLPTKRSELQKIEQDYLPTLTRDDPVFQVLPIEMIDSDVIAFEQLDDYSGLQSIRALNGQPGNVSRVGIKRYIVAPGVYGEYTSIGEPEIVARRPIGTFGLFSSDLRDLVAEKQRFLLHRRIARIRQVAWSMLTTGTFSVSNASGSITHTDSYNAQTFNAAFPWSDPVFSARNLADIQNSAPESQGV